jgi:PAS domain S-box-containing protein/putative nucleotidyltransferase with HDIG domain
MVGALILVLVEAILIFGLLISNKKRKEKERELRESEEKYRSLFDNSIDAILLTVPDGKIMKANSEACRIFGRTEEEICRVGREGLLDPTDPRLKVALEERKRTGRFRGELTFVRKNGTRFPGEVTTALFKDRDGNQMSSMIVRDMTERKNTEEKLRDALEILRKAFGATVQVMVTAVEVRDPYTSGHQIRSAELADAIAKEMGLPQEKVDGLRVAASIHDIGKISIPAEILSKPTKLTDLEFSLIKEHPKQGYQMTKHVESPWPLAEIVYQHHERMDGSGYPRKLKGDEILMEARILAVADVVEAMASHRPYRPALGLPAALAEIENNKGMLFDADAVDACLRLFREKSFSL